LTAAQDFIDNPLAFCADNIILVSEFQGEMRSGLHVFTLEHAPNLIGKQLGRMLNVYRLKPSGSVVGILAYWCPYRGNSVHGTTVGYRARFMFTATMDGCSLGVGSDAGRGTRFVTHANAGTFGAKFEPQLGMDKAREMQRDMQRSLIARKHGADGNVAVVSPLNYMKDVDGELALKSTTFGYRPDGVDDWHFYAHRYHKDMSKHAAMYFLRGTTRVF